MKWTLDPAHTNVEVSAKHMMVTTVRGRFSGTTGEIDYDPADPLRTKVRIEVPAATVSTGDDKRDAHLRSADFLDVEKFPKIAFESRKIERDGDDFKVTGDLTIRGVTKPIVVEVEVSDVMLDPWGNDRVGFEAEGKIDRREWGLVWNMPIASGGMLVGNQLKFDIALAAIAPRGAPREDVEQAVDQAEQAARA